VAIVVFISLTAGDGPVHQLLPLSNALCRWSVWAPRWLPSRPQRPNR